MVAIPRGCVVEIDEELARSVCLACHVFAANAMPPEDLEEELASFVSVLEHFFGLEFTFHGEGFEYESEDGSAEDFN